MGITKALAVIVVTVPLTAVAGTAAAQSSAPQMSQRAGYFTFGGTMGVVLAETPSDVADIAANVEAPLGTWFAVRGQIGRQREFAPVRMTTDTLTLRRYTASLVLFVPHVRDRGHTYLFAGMGAYQFRYAKHAADDKTAMAAQLGIGVESPAIGPVVLTAEGTFRRDFELQHASPLTLAVGFKVRY